MSQITRRRVQEAVVAVHPNVDPIDRLWHRTTRDHALGGHGRRPANRGHPEPVRRVARRHPPSSPTPEVRRQMFGLLVDACTREEAVARCRRSIVERQRLLVGVLNAAKVANLTTDAHLREGLLECDLMLADGQSLVWAARLLGRPLPERVAGIDLFQSLLELAGREHLRVYLLGARPAVLARLTNVVAERYPGVVLVGARDGYFRDEEAADVATDIAAAKPDMLFLGITSPKKEIFLGSYGPALGVPVLHGVGGSFDVLAGITKRAPETWQRVGLEWAYRLKQEPGRLWWRYLRTNTAFVGLVVGEMVRPRPLYLPLKAVHD